MPALWVMRYFYPEMCEGFRKLTMIEKNDELVNWAVLSWSSVLALGVFSAMATWRAMKNPTPPPAATAAMAAVATTEEIAEEISSETEENRNGLPDLPTEEGIVLTPLPKIKGDKQKKKRVPLGRRPSLITGHLKRPKTNRRMILMREHNVKKYVEDFKE